jgi:hypothetical protein
MEKEITQTVLYAKAYRKYVARGLREYRGDGPIGIEDGGHFMGRTGNPEKAMPFAPGRITGCNGYCTRRNPVLPEYPYGQAHCSTDSFGDPGPASSHKKHPALTEAIDKIIRIV